MRRLTLLFSMLLCFTAAANAGLVVGAYTGGNCYPFSCFASDEGIAYQEIYSKTAFSGPITISSISFYLYTESQNSGRDSATYTISLSTTPVSLGGMSGLNANVGVDHQLFGTFTLDGGSMPGVLTFTGTPFSYDPLNGNLLMQVDVSAITSTCFYCSFMQADVQDNVVQRAYLTSIMDGSRGNDTNALVTGFNVDAPVPEPGTVALLGGGLLGLAAFCRRKRA